jgi:DNA-binding CsgD family transcriptional regulator
LARAVTGVDRVYRAVDFMVLRAVTCVCLALGEIAQAERWAHAWLDVIARGVWAFAPDALEVTAALRTELGAEEDAARLLGAAHAGRVTMGIRRNPDPIFDPEAVIASVRERLGTDAFDSAWAEGEALSLEEAVAYAMRGRGPRQRPASGWESLTPMESQVVDLVAEGLSNKQVAERLFVSPRTVSTHLSHVFAKLGVSSRSELTAAAAKRGV